MTERPDADPAPSGATPRATSAEQARAAGNGDLHRALLAGLGLPADATPEQVEAAHERVGAYLASAPAPLRAWADQQATAADAAHAVLTGRAGDVLARRVVPATAATTTTSSRSGGLQRWATNPLVLLAVIAAIVVGVWKFGPQGSTSSTPPVTMSDQSTSAPSAPAPSATPLDAAKVKDLTAKVEKNPTDVQSLAQLGDLYFGAEKYTEAVTYRQKLVNVEPKNTDALLALGVAQFNAGDAKAAEAQWTKAIEIDPKKTEAYYDLGFLQLTKTPPDSAKAKEYWDKVVELDGNGPLAQKVQNHMGALMTPAPTAPASPTAKS